MKKFRNILLSAAILFVYGCASTVSDKVSSISYATAETDIYDSAEKIDIKLANKIYFNFDKSSLTNSSKELISKYVKFAKDAKKQSNRESDHIND